MSSSSLSTPLIASSAAILSIQASTKISRPASQVFSTLLDTSTWSRWNTFVPEVTIRHAPSSDPSATKDNPAILQKGTQMTFHVRMDASKPNSVTNSNLVVTTLEQPSLAPTTTSGQGHQEQVYRVAWAIDNPSSGFAGVALPGWVLRSERVHEIRDLGEGGCEIKTWECMAGSGAYLVKRLHGQRLQKGFENWVLELKKFVENG